jgi:hypothetical protein
MRITEGCINHNAVRIIGELAENSYDFCSAKNAEAERENAMYMAMTLGNIMGVLEMAQAMKDVLKS